MPATPSSPIERRVASGRVDALDGLRALAVAGVLLFHLGVRQAKGGYLGVSLFFTLSGYLITSLLLVEHDRTGRIDLRAFWGRRARRLVPAAVGALGLVVASAVLGGGPGQLRALRDDVLAALAGSANWHLIRSGDGYAALWQAPSPIQHFWSLAVEQQLYVIVPLVVAGSLHLARGRRWLLATALAVAAAASTAAAAVLGSGDAARVYYGTDTRAAELLVGALLAVGVARRRRRVPAIVVVAALAVLVGSWTLVGETSPVLFRGVLLGHAALTAVVLAGLDRPGGDPLARALGAAPVRAIGRISYGIYLFHWPIFLWVSPQRTGLPALPLAALRVGLTLAVAALSHRFVERPFLAHHDGARLRVLVAPAFAVVTAAVLVTATAPRPDLLLLNAAGATAPLAPPAPSVTGTDGTTTTTGATPSPGGPAITPAPAPTGDQSHHRPDPEVAPTPLEPPADATPPLPLPPRTPLLPGERPRIYLAGDSTIFGLGMVLAPYGQRTGRFDVWNGGAMACHVVRGGDYQWAAAPPKATEPTCNDWESERTRRLAEIRPHVTVVAFADIDLLDRRLPGSSTWHHLGEPAYDALARRELDAFATMLERSGTRTLWLTTPRIRGGVIDHVPPVRDFPESDPARVERWNELLAETAAHHPTIQVVDYRGWLQTLLGDELDPSARPDGVHLTPPYLRKEARWLTPQLLEAAARP